MQHIVFGAHSVATTIPTPDRLTANVTQHPALACLHTGLVDMRAEHIVVIAHNHAVFRINHFALSAFDIEHRASAEFLWIAVGILTVVGDG